MSTTYAELLNTVRDWANRDSAVLSDTTVGRCLRFAADTAYKELKIPPLENTLNYVITDENNTAPSNLQGAIATGADDLTDRFGVFGIRNVSLPIPEDSTLPSPRN